MNSFTCKIIKNIQHPTAVESLVLFRVSFGLIMFWEIYRYFYYGWIEDIYSKSQFHFQYRWFQWIEPLPANGMYILFGGLGFLALMISLGYYYRIASILFFLGYSYVFLIDQAAYNNHFYLICLLSFVMALAPLHNSYSLDVILGYVNQAKKFPALWLWLIRFHMGLVYVYGGIAKFDPDWMGGLATKELMLKANQGTILENLIEYAWFPYFYAWAGMLFDLLIPFFMLYKPLRIWAFLAALIFHVNNYIVFPIGIFPLLSIVLTLMFFDADFPKKLAPNKLRILISYYYHKRLSKIVKNKFDGEVVYYRTEIHKIMIIFIGIYSAFHLIFPFRHLLYPGMTNWHEEGHYFAWRMMLRQKITLIQFNVTHPKTGEQRYADPGDYLNSSQFKVFAGNPGMILLFAHHLDKLVQNNAGFDPIITAKINVSLNGRPFRELVDQNLDLSNIPAYEPSYNWIKSFEN